MVLLLTKWTTPMLFMPMLLMPMLLTPMLLVPMLLTPMLLVLMLLIADASQGNTAHADSLHDAAETCYQYFNKLLIKFNWSMYCQSSTDD